MTSDEAKERMRVVADAVTDALESARTVIEEISDAIISGNEHLTAQGLLVPRHRNAERLLSGFAKQHDELSEALSLLHRDFGVTAGEMLENREAA